VPSLAVRAPLLPCARNLEFTRLPGTLIVEVAEREIRGSTTIVELLKRYPDGRAARLMSELSWPCAHCGGAFHEPLTMAAKRHDRDPRAVLAAFRALEHGGPDAEQVAAAQRMVH
jgi:hypothetical protein